MDVTLVVLTVLVALGIGAGCGYFLRTILTQKGVTQARQSASIIIQEAEQQKKRLALEAKEESLKFRSSAEEEIRDRRNEVRRREQHVNNREEQAERRKESLEQRERNLNKNERGLEVLKENLEELRNQEEKRLEAVSGLTVGEAKEQLLEKAEQDIQQDLARRFRQIEELANEEAEQNARKVITLAIHRLASEVVSENTTAIVPIPSDDMKGRIIGREGRNIRAIEAATGVDVVIDDTPEAVTVSCFDPVRREIAKLAIAKLVHDGRIHPARIEDVVKKTREEVDQTIWKEGEQAAFEVGAQGMPIELIKLLGRLKYRYSYGENVLMHSKEVGHLAGMMATEIGADVKVAKWGGLLHDIGKAQTHEVEGPHAEIGADIARKCGIPKPIEIAIREHHDDVKSSNEAFLVAAADAISAARPGARRDTLEHYVKRLEALEEVANSFSGVEKSYAIQAGREVRILVQPDSVDDTDAAILARNVAKKIEDNLVYPGQIKVIVIRETRNEEIAR